MSTVASLIVRVAGDTKDAEKAFAGLERAGTSLERSYAGLGTAAGKAFGALDQGLGKVGQALGPIANVLPGLPGPVNALAGAFGGLVPVAGVLGGIGIALGALGGIAVGVVGGLVALGKSAADAGDAMLVLSQQSGVSVENLSRFQYVEQQTDASVDKIVGSIRKLGTNLATGSKQASTAITSIGLSLADIKKLKPEDAFVAIVDGLGKIPGAGQRAAAGAAIFGKGWHDVSQLAAEDLRGLMKEADLFGATMTTEFAVAGDRFNDTLGQMSTVVEGFKRAAGAGVLPVLTAFAEVLRDQVIVQLQATGTTAATVQGTFETFAIKVATTMLQVSASVARGVATVADLFSKPIISESVFYREFQRLIRVVGVLNGIKLDALDTVAEGAQATAIALSKAADQMEKDLPGALARVKAEIAATAAAMKAGQGAAIGYGTATAAAAEKLNTLIATLSGETVLARAREMTDALAAMADRGLKPSAAGAKAVSDALNDAAAVIRSTGKTVPAAMGKIWASLQPPAEVVRDLRGFSALFGRSISQVVPTLKQHLRPVTKAFTDAFRIDAQVVGKQVEKDLNSAALRDALDTWGKTAKTQMSGILGGMFSGQTGMQEGVGQMFGQLESFASARMSSLVDSMGKQFGNVLKGGSFDFKGMFGAEASAAGIAAGAAVGATVGTAFGRGFGKAAGIAMGAVSGALAGGMYGGPWGAAAGAAVGAIAGWWGGKTKEKEQQAALGQARDEMLVAFGTVGKLEDAAKRLGVSWDALWQTKDTIRFQAALKHLNLELAREKELLKDLSAGLITASESGDLLGASLIKAMNPKLPGATEAIGAFMTTQVKTATAGIDAFLSNTTIKTQAGAAAISASIAGLYETLRSQGVAPSAAFAALEPIIGKLQAQLTATGLAGSAAFAPLAALATLSADAIAGPMFDAMAGLEQGLTATFNLGLLNQEAFAGFAAELYAGYKALEEQGKGGATAMAGMQGALQKVWELSEDFGYTLSDNERGLVDFAKEAGLIGDQFRPAADRMATAVEALVNRLDQFLDRLDGIGPAAATASQELADTLGRTTVPPIDLRFRPVIIGDLPGGGSVDASGTAIPALGSGGIVRRPTLALIGEQGPEAVVPLSKDFGGDVTTSIYLDGDVIARSTTKRQPNVLRAYGVMR